MHIYLLNPPLSKAILDCHVRCSDSLVPLQTTQHTLLSSGYAAFRLLQGPDWHCFLQVWCWSQGASPDLVHARCHVS
jgi:hypothetical protein